MVIVLVCMGIFSALVWVLVIWHEAKYSHFLALLMPQKMQARIYLTLCISLPASHSGKTESDPKLDATTNPFFRSPQQSQSKVRAENNQKKKDTAPRASKLEEEPVKKDFLPLEIRGILDDLQLDTLVPSTKQERADDGQKQKSAVPTALARSHSPTKRKTDKLAAKDEPQATSKKRHYDTDEVRQYIIRQQEERKKRQIEEKKAQKEATEQKNKRLQELYKKQRDVLANKAKSTTAPESTTRRLQETYSKLLLEQTFLEEPPQQEVIGW